MGYKLFLDDTRNPVHCVTYMQNRIGRLNPVYLENGWAIARNFEAFKNTVESMGLPEFVSFDHDLTEEHYNLVVDWDLYYSFEEREMTGYDCAKWLVNYCLDNKLELPKWAVHSMNPVGVDRISHYLNGAEKWTKERAGTGKTS
jgi:hypothetical protein